MSIFLLVPTLNVSAETNNIDLSISLEKQSGDGWDWNLSTKTLTLDNTNLKGDIYLPKNIDITIDSNNAVIEGNIVVENGNNNKLTIIGNSLKFNNMYASNDSIYIIGIRIDASSVSASSNECILSLTSEAYLNLDGYISIGGSGSTTGMVILDGKSSIIIKGQYASLSTGKILMKDLESIINIDSEETAAFTSGNTDAFDGLHIPESSRVGIIYSDTVTLIDNNDEALNKIELTSKYYTINLKLNKNGTISLNDTIKLLPEENKTYAFTTDIGYHIKDVSVDGVSMGVITQYTFNNVTENHTVEVSFEKNKYNIVASSSDNGTISDLGTTEVEYDENKTYTFTADKEYHIKDILVDGISMGVITEYTFINIKEEHMIEALFDKNKEFTEANKNVINNPKTLDNITIYFLMGFLSFIGILGVIFYLRKNQEI